ncbi:MAG: hypothetical protein KGS60_16105 [Verrucomicrobia bacterium]|nr:hypothetical protein [Verrucomicrobiota bacterium]
MTSWSTTHGLTMNSSVTVGFHWARLMDEKNTHLFKPLAEVKKDLEAAGIPPDKTIIY